MLGYWKFKEISELFIWGHFEAARRMLMQVQAHYIALHDEVSVLKKQVQELEDILFLSQNLSAEGEQYWLQTGSIRHGPFCRPCYEYIGKLVRLESHKTVWRCPYCGFAHSREPAPRMAANGSLTRPGKVIHFKLPAIPSCNQ